MDNVDRCGAPTKTGKSCRQIVDLLPCRYHNAAGFDVMVQAISTGQLGLCPSCRCWWPSGEQHSCAARQAAAALARLQATTP